MVFPALSLVSGILLKGSCSNAGPVTAFGCCATATAAKPSAANRAGRVRRIRNILLRWNGVGTWYSPVWRSQERNADDADQSPQMNADERQDLSKSSSSAGLHPRSVFCYT